MKYFPEDDDYLKALVKFSDIKRKKWLLLYFDLYKFTLNWPPGLPPINRTNLVEGTLRKKFNFTYRETLNNFEYFLDNEKQTLNIL